MMLYLYDRFREHPYSPVDVRQLEEGCETNPAEMNWNLVYLEKCGFVELGKAVAFPPYVTAMITLTVKGIDLIEEPEALRNRFQIPEEINH